MVFRWEVFLKVSGWVSEYPGVNNLFKYLGYRKTRSEASRKIYGNALFMFCQHTGKTPDELVALRRKEIESLMEGFGYKKKGSGCCSGTVNVLLYNLKTFFSVNGFRNENELDVELFYQPAGARTRPEYVPTLEEALRMAECAKTLRDKAMILVMVFSGLRNSTLRALLIGDIREELERGEDIILIRVYADMKKLVFAACKGNIEYFTFICKKATDILRLYLAQKLDKIGEIRDQDPLFSCEYNQLPPKERFSKPLSDRQLQVIVKQAAKDAKIKGWKAVSPHALRKVYEALLRSQLKDGSRLDIQEQIFLMGHHTQPGGLTPYFVAKVEDLRKKYSKLIFVPSDEKLSKALEVLKAASEVLRFCGTPSSSSGMEKLASLNPSEASKAIQDFVEEIQRTDDVGRKTPVNSDPPSERKDQSRTALSNDPSAQARVESASKQKHPNSDSKIPQSALGKAKTPTKNDQNLSTKQTALDIFIDSCVVRGNSLN